MQIKKILARFLSLLDVSIILLGMFIILLTSANFQEKENLQKEESASLTEQDTILTEQEEFEESDLFLHSFIKNNFNMIVIYACCDGKQKGKYYLLDKDYNYKESSEINEDSLKSKLNEIKRSRNESVSCVFLVTEEGAWDSANTIWSHEIIDEMEKECGFKIVYIPNFLPSPPKCISEED